MPQGFPGERDGPPAIDQRGANQDKGPQYGGIEGDIPLGLRPLSTQGRFQERRIPVGRVNGGMREPAGKPPHSAGGIGCTPISDFDPGAQAYGACQTQTADRPGEGNHAADIVIGTAGNVGEFRTAG
jgi:hypothetical protein